MDRLISKIKRTLKDGFKGCEVELPPPEEGEKLSGFLIWRGFDDDDQVRRQERLWKVLEKVLNKAERQRISVIFTTTPAEMSVMREG
jgi:hypothetical protein